MVVSIIESNISKSKIYLTIFAQFIIRPLKIISPALKFNCILKLCGGRNFIAAYAAGVIYQPNQLLFYIIEKNK